MKILDRLLNRSPRGDASDPGSVNTSSPGADQLPIPGYDRLADSQVGARLPQLSQIELAAVETYERSHEERPRVLDKLRYMHTSEPLPDYDTLANHQITEALAGADTKTVKAVRDYERKFQHRQSVLDETARVLPTSQASAQEDRARHQQKELVREGLAGREKTAGGLASADSPV